MDSDLLIKCFIAFCIVAIVCNLIYSSKLCNKDLVEGQESNASSTGECSKNPSASGDRADGFTDESCKAKTSKELCEPAGEDGHQLCKWTPRAAPQNGAMDSVGSPNQLNNIMHDLNENIFNKSIQDTLSYVLDKMPGTANAPLPQSIKATTTFDQFGDNEDSLNFLEMIVQKILDMDDSVFKTFVEALYADPGSYCEKDINEYIISIILLQYNKINKEKKDSYINISNRLSRYIPDILEKIQNVNITCGGDISARSNIMDVMFYRLFKNNNTIINIGSLDKLVKELNNLPKVYGVVILLCITFIIVKIFGMFNMKLEV
jgi:hypothetical protein